MKAKISIVLLIMLLSSVIVYPNNIYAKDNYSSGPSKWAEDEINLALNHNLVPDDLKGNYTQNILRGEYVLLALELYKKTGNNVEITNPEPFIDIKGHKYENELIMAYNAGIINGYEDGTFKPDEKITRQEIAALIVQLLKAIDSKEDLNASKSYDYIDAADIDEWVKPYIDYCYENKILKGVSELQINPKGNATREQSIILIYRLGIKLDKDNTESVNDVIAVSHSHSEEKSQELYITDEFNNNFSEEIVTAIEEITKNDNVNITDITSKSAVISISNIGMINIVKSKYEITLYTSTNDLDNVTFEIALLKMLEVLDETESIKNIYQESKLSLENSVEKLIRKKIGEKDYFEAQSLKISSDNNEEVLYTFRYYDSL
ncbi:S-layer homology domain-containing protein [Caldisalinibacter kiritimatiensis]|uniref:S-layer protein n=1 Tax=Caldisalinibacter kiritimatiensis TaxID=1304284 RepID=R1CY74_9FIRM|nr:S-layer homology domain-containing protein [Caldisalinibacter kiritimatiensis]EOD01524.1 S-layer protein [Caldisalinibacter kiritimatiensis]